MKNLNEDRKERYYVIALTVVLVIYAVIGLILYDDYGCGPDEGMERQTSLVNLKYVIQKLKIPISHENETWMEYLPQLKEYRDRYYGTALHFPLVMIESAFHFTLEPSQFYGMRHLYTFINYYLGVFCLGKLLSSRFRSKKYALIGILLMILSPRFFAESFYNNKDVIFMAWYAVSAFMISRWFRKRNLTASVMLAFSLALTCNTRFNGIVFLPVFVFLYLFDWFRCRKAIGLRYFLLVIFLTAVFFILITPNFWEDPLKTFAETMQFNMHHPNHGSDGNLFRGVLVDAAQTLTFIPVWISITVPVAYLVLTVFGSCLYIFYTGRSIVRMHLNEIDLTDVMMFICGFGAILFIILKHVTIYNGWRHCYFAYPCMIYFAVYLLSFFNKRKMHVVYKISCLLMAVSMVVNGIWIVRNHPYEYVYFNPIARKNAVSFSGDYWGISSRNLLEFIVTSDPQRILKINHSYSQAGSINRGLLPEEKRAYIELTYDEGQDVDYYIVCRDDIPSVDIPLNGYEKIYSVTVDLDEIGAVFKRITK